MDHSIFHPVRGVVTQYLDNLGDDDDKLDGVGPVDNFPSTD